MRVKANYTIADKVKSDFDKLCKELSINKSQWIENKMREFLKENEKEAKQ